MNNAHPSTNSSEPNQPHQNTAYSTFDDLTAFVTDSWLNSGGPGGPTLLWNRIISDISIQDDLTRADSPVSSPEEARTMMVTPITWYFNSIGSTTVSAVKTPEGYDIPRMDMPTFRMQTHALAGVNAVAGNAMMSTRWLDATANLVAALDVTSIFISNVADREGEGFEFLKNLIQNVRIYFDSLARHADPVTAQKALAMITKEACNEDFLLNPVQLVELLSGGLSLAQWDDTRVLMYDAISVVQQAMIDSRNASEQDSTRSLAETMLEDSTGQLTDVFMDQIQETFDQSILFLQHDILRLSKDSQAADRFLYEHSDVEALADTYAARLIGQKQWDKLLSFADEILETNPNQQLTMIPTELVPYEWESIREMALQKLVDIDALRDLYRNRIVEAYGREDIANIDSLRMVSGAHWPEEVRHIVQQYADGTNRFARNLAYEQLLINEQLSTAAWKYSLQFPKARMKLAKTIAVAHPEKAREIILGPIGLDGSYKAALPSRLVAYKNIEKRLHKYADVFSQQEARGIAQKLAERYSSLRTLAAVLHDFL